MMEEKNISEEIIQEKVENKVKNKSQKIKQSQLKECDVLLYNAKKQTVIVSFDGFGYELSNVIKNPGNKIHLKYSGKIGTPGFKLSLA